MKKFKRKSIKVEDISIFFSSKERNETNFGQRMRGYGTLGGVRRRDSIGETLGILHNLKEEEISRESYELIKRKFDRYSNENEGALHKIKQNERTVLSRSKDYFLHLQNIREKIFPELKGGLPIVPDFKDPEYQKQKEVFRGPHHVEEEEEVWVNNLVEKKAEKILKISTLRNEMEELKSNFHASKNRALGSLQNHQKNIRYSMFRLEGLSDEYESKLEELSNREERNIHVEVMLKKKGERLESLLNDLFNKEKRLKSLKKSIEKKMEEEKKLRDVVGTEERHKRRIQDRKAEIKGLEVEIEKLYTDIERIKVDKIEADKITEELKQNLSNLESNLVISLKNFEKMQNQQPQQLQEEEEEESEEDQSARETPGKTASPCTPRPDPVEETLIFVDQVKSPNVVKGDPGFEEISRDVEEFKTDFTSLFKSIDVVKKRMAFYSSDLNKSNSARIRGPKGHVAIIFTSVEGSHGLWDRDVQLMLDCMKIHNKVLRKTLTECNGYEVKSEGDSFMTSFQTVDAAVKFALQCQVALNEAKWPKKLSDYPACQTEFNPLTGHPIFNGLRVSMGIHDGRPICERDPVTKRTDYFGPMVNKSARIGSCSIGGAVALSQDTFNAIRHYVGTGTINNQEVQRLGTKVSLKVIGRKRLKGVAKEETIRWIFPDCLKRRASLLFDKQKEKEKSKKQEEESNHRLDRIIDVLNEKRMKLDRRRSKITSKIGFELKLKSLESSNAEKEELISYLRKKMKDLKYSYERALELKQSKLENNNNNNNSVETEENNNDTEAHIIKKDVESVISKYKKMQDMYSELRGSFGTVEEVFNNRLKDELKKFQGDLSQMKDKFVLQKNRNVFDRKIWEVQKKILKTKIRHCEGTGDKQNLLIEELHEQVKEAGAQITARRRQMITERRQRIRYENKKSRFLEMERKIERDLEDGKVVSLLRNTTIQLDRGKDSQLILSKSSDKKKKRVGAIINPLTSLKWEEDMVIRNTEIFLPEKQREKQNNMVTKDTAFLDDLSKEIGDIMEMSRLSSVAGRRRRYREGRKKLWRTQPPKKRRRFQWMRYTVDDGETSFIDSSRTSNLTPTKHIVDDGIFDDNICNFEEQDDDFITTARSITKNAVITSSSSPSNIIITEHEKKRLKKKIRRMKKKYQELEKSSLWFSDNSKLLRVKRIIKEVSGLLKDAPVIKTDLQIPNNNSIQGDDNKNNKKRFLFTPLGRTRRKKVHFLGTTVKKARKNRFQDCCGVLDGQQKVSKNILIDDHDSQSSTTRRRRKRRPHTSSSSVDINIPKKKVRSLCKNTTTSDDNDQEVFLPSVHEHPLTRKFFDKNWAGKRGELLKTHRRGFWMTNDNEDRKMIVQGTMKSRRTLTMIEKKKRRNMMERWKKYSEDHENFFVKSGDDEFKERVRKFKRWTELSRRKPSFSALLRNNQQKVENNDNFSRSCAFKRIEIKF